MKQLYTLLFIFFLSTHIILAQELYAGTDGNLYFNDGTPGPAGGWRQVSLVP